MRAGGYAVIDMRIAITGATGNVGTSLLQALEGEHEVDEIVALARRRAGFDDPRIRFVAADVAGDDREML